ncbi:hypothetical protein ACNVED_05665 [Legionella sp. D16C41]|uniref:hypothetical protein n=1 Tax=Legionella sp. D16C41 TaxID=3402688 RepID=UPI003AF5CE5D
MVSPVFSYWFNGSSNNLEEVCNYLHNIDNYEAKEIICCQEASNKCVILQESDNNKIQLTYLNARKVQRKTLIIPSDLNGYVIEDKSNNNKKYTSIVSAVQEIIGNKTVILKNFNYARTMLNQTHKTPLSDDTITEILTISNAYALAVTEKSEEAENLRAECLFYRFKCQFSNLNNIDLFTFQKGVTEFEKIINDELETNIIRSQCYFYLADLMEELRNTNNDEYSYYTIYAWYALYMAKINTNNTKIEFKKIANKYKLITLELVGREESDFAQFDKYFTQNISLFLFKIFIEHWKSESTEADEVKNIMKLIKKIVNYSFLYKEFNIISLPNVNKLKKQVLDSAQQFKTTNQLFNWIETNLPCSLNKDLLYRCIYFIEKNSVFLKRELIINFTEFDDSELRNKKRRHYSPLLFNTSSQVDKSKLRGIITELKPQKITIDAHGSENMTITLDSNKSPEEAAIYLASLLEGFNQKEWVINLLNCFAAGSSKNLISPEQSFASRFCIKLAKLNIEATVIARLDEVEVDKVSGKKSVNGEHHKNKTKFKFKSDKNNIIQIQYFEYSSNSWKDYTPTVASNNSFLPVI